LNHNLTSAISWFNPDAYEIAELLLSRRAYVDPVSECGTPLYIAAKNGSAKMLKLLLRHQADVSLNFVFISICVLFECKTQLW